MSLILKLLRTAFYALTKINDTENINPCHRPEVCFLWSKSFLSLEEAAKMIVFDLLSGLIKVLSNHRQKCQSFLSKIMFSVC